MKNGRHFCRDKTNLAATTLALVVTATKLVTNWQPQKPPMAPESAPLLLQIVVVQKTGRSLVAVNCLRFVLFWFVLAAVK